MALLRRLIPVSRTCIEDTTRSTKTTYYFNYTHLRIFMQTGHGLWLCVCYIPMCIYYALIVRGSYQSYSWAAALLVAVRHILQLVIQHHLTCQAVVARDENWQTFRTEFSTGMPLAS